MSFLHSFEPVILVLHYIVCIFMIIVILLQAGKGADMGAAFGAGSSQTLFGARGAATFLSKVTTIGAMVFLMTSVSLAAISKNGLVGGSGSSAVESVLDTETITDKKEEAPVAPANPDAPTAPATEEKEEAKPAQ